MSDEIEEIEEVDESEAPDLSYARKMSGIDWTLENMADEILRADSKRELCRECGEYGEETGHIESVLCLDKEENPQLDDSGNVLYADFSELACKNGHRWFQGEGKSRGIDGSNPILFENHLQERRRREIYTSVGVPDPSITRGMYYRTHPNGRRVNTKEQRTKHGASFYR